MNHFFVEFGEYEASVCEWEIKVILKSFVFMV